MSNASLHFLISLGCYSRNSSKAGPQNRWGGFHAIAENIRKALVAQHLLIVSAEHGGIRHNHNPGDIETTG